jgi:hypothetical protein
VFENSGQAHSQSTISVQYEILVFNFTVLGETGEWDDRIRSGRAIVALSGGGVPDARLDLNLGIRRLWCPQLI